VEYQYLNSFHRNSGDGGRSPVARGRDKARKYGTLLLYNILGSGNDELCGGFFCVHFQCRQYDGSKFRVHFRSNLYLLFALSFFVCPREKEGKRVLMLLTRRVTFKFRVICVN
jgi:hypothetical protein